MDMTLMDFRPALERILASAFPAEEGAGEMVKALLRSALALYDDESSVANRPVRLAPAGAIASWQIRKAQQLMRENLEGCLSISSIAEACGLSRSHFSRGFKLCVGSSPSHWLAERRIEQAQRLLLDTEMSLAEVAKHCGFAEQCHFTRTFARAVGMPPGVWRRSFGPSSQSWFAPSHEHAGERESRCVEQALTYAVSP